MTITDIYSLEEVYINSYSHIQNVLQVPDKIENAEHIEKPDSEKKT